MNIDVLIEECIADLDTKRIPLSRIIMKCIRIAQNTGDVESLLVLKVESTGTMSKRDNTKLSDEMRKIFIEAGFNEDDFKTAYQEMTRDYITRRTYLEVDYKTKKTKDMVAALSIGEIESTVDNIKLKMQKNTVPDGLHSLDLYYKDQERQVIDNMLIASLDNFNKVIDRTRSKVYELLIKMEGMIVMQSTNEITPVNNGNVFIIHGHDEAKWRELQQYLKEDFGLNPIVLSEQPDKGMTIIEKFEYYANQCCYAFAMFTPDDVIDNDGNKYFQARPNVIFELGWFCSNLGRDRVCILFKDGENMNIFSDFQGVIQKRFTNSISEVYREIKIELNSVGIM